MVMGLRELDLQKRQDISRPFLQAQSEIRQNIFERRQEIIAKKVLDENQYQLYKKLSNPFNKNQENVPYLERYCHFLVLTLGTIQDTLVLNHQGEPKQNKDNMIGLLDQARPIFNCTWLNYTPLVSADHPIRCNSAAKSFLFFLRAGPFFVYLFLFGVHISSAADPFALNHIGH
jgi:hypothetical protein